MTDLETSIARLTEFRRAIEDDGVVDEDSGLTAADLDAVLAAAKTALGTVSIEYASLDDLAKRARSEGSPVV